MNVHDERISSYLDDTLPPSERSAFEVELLENADLQQQVAELAQLRQDVAQLPRFKARPDFAQRVVAAALAAKADQDAQITPARKEANPSASKKTSRRALIGGLAVAASVAIILGSLPFFLRPGSTETANNANNNSPGVTEPENYALAPVLAALPGEGETLVLRIKSPKSLGAGNLLREAFEEQGIQKRRPTDRNGAIVGNAYRAQLGTDGERVRPEGAFFVEMSPQELELALSRLADTEQKVKFIPETRLAVAKSEANTGSNDPRSHAAGESAPQVGGEEATGDFVQELSTALFPIPKTAPEAPAVAPSTPTPSAPKGKVRVLILIEAVEE
jgi:hypothetical protein